MHSTRLPFARHNNITKYQNSKGFTTKVLFFGKKTLPVHYTKDIKIFFNGKKSDLSDQ